MANWKATVLFVLITLPGFLLRMAVYWMVRRCIRSLAWKPVCAMNRLKYGNHQQTIDTCNCAAAAIKHIYTQLRPQPILCRKTIPSEILTECRHKLIVSRDLHPA